jgi:hypothetical protein
MAFRTACTPFVCNLLSHSHKRRTACDAFS